jgi:hypothetical protein
MPTVASEKEENFQCRNYKRVSQKAIANSLHLNRGADMEIFSLVTSEVPKHNSDTQHISATSSRIL